MTNSSGARKLSDDPKALKTTDFSYYLNLDVFLDTYQQIQETASTRTQVNWFHSNLHTLIFPVQDQFFQVREVVSPSDVDGGPHFIRCVSDLQRKRVFLYEGQKRSIDTDPSAWEVGLKHLVNHALSARAMGLRHRPAPSARPTEKGQDESSTLYLTVHIGTYSKFYELPGGQDTAREWEPAGGRCYELADDEEELWLLWDKLRAAVLQQRRDELQEA